MPARRTAERAAYHHGDLPRAFVAAALELIAREGAEALTLRRVARAVGVNHAAAYRHFDDKEALLAAVAEQGFVTLAERMTAALADACAEATPRCASARWARPTSGSRSSSPRTFA